MATTKKNSGRAASVALARQRLRSGNQAGQPARASATIPAAMLSVVQHPDATPDPSAPAPAPTSSLAKIVESQREALRRLDALERLVQRAIEQIESLRRDLASDPTTPDDPDPDDPTTPEPVPQPEPGEPADPEPAPDPDAPESA